MSHTYVNPGVNGPCIFMQKGWIAGAAISAFYYHEICFYIYIVLPLYFLYGINQRGHRGNRGHQKKTFF